MGEVFCAFCGHPAETDTAGVIICHNPSCLWRNSNNMNENKISYINDKKEIKNMKTNENNSNLILRYYYVEYINNDSELLQANCIHDLIAKLLKQEENFTPFVEKCYCAFTKSSISELIQFYNHFGEDAISKISEFDNLNVVYGKE